MALLAVVGLIAAGPGLALDGVALAMGDVTPLHILGAVTGVAGLVCLAWAIRLAFAGRRWYWQLLAVPLVLVLLQAYGFPMLMAGMTVNAPRGGVAPAATLGLPGARDVSFRATDGVRLAGWYVPGRSRAAVVLAHGSHDTRTATLAHLRLLAALGYGVLAFDARGHGESGGAPNALGWRGAADVAGAVRFLHGQRAVDPRRIGVLGLSMGAEEGLRAAAQGIPVAAVVADGAGASTSADARAGGEAGLGLLVERLGYATTALLSGTREPPSLVGRAARVHVPVLLIASGRRGELRIDRALRAATGPGATLWSVPDAGHTRALERHPAAYRDRVATFLGRALRPLR